MIGKKTGGRKKSGSGVARYNVVAEGEGLYQFKNEYFKNNKNALYMNQLDTKLYTQTPMMQKALLLIYEAFFQVC